MRINRGLLFWGLGFITAGAVALAIQQGLLDRDTMAGAWRLWPLILVAIGVSLIVARTPAAPLGTALAAIVIGTIVGTAIAVGPGIAVGCGSASDPASLEDHSGTFGSGVVSLDWRLDCGTLDVSMTGDSGWKASVGSTGSDQPTVSGSDGQLRIVSADTSGWFLDRGRERWRVTLPTAPSYDAHLRANAGTFTLGLAGGTFSSFDFQPNAADIHMDVSGAAVSDLDLEMNAGSANIIGSADTLLEGTIEMNAGSVKLCVPTDMPIRITASGTAFSASLGGNGLTQDGDTWTSSGYDASAAHRITLSVHGNAASLDLNPDGGCK
jgi:hypothetical protein